MTLQKSLVHKGLVTKALEIAVFGFDHHLLDGDHLFPVFTLFLQ